MPDALRIGIVSWDFDPPQGGLGRAMRGLRDELEAMGHAVETLTPANGGWLLGCTRFAGGQMLFSLLLPLVLRRWIVRVRLAILIAPCGPCGVFLPPVPGCKRILIAYHTYAQQARAVPGQRWKKLFVPWERRMLRGADAIFCYAESAWKALQNEYGIAESAIRFLPQLWDWRSWAFAAEPEREPGLCVCVGRLNARKNAEVLLRAWPAVAERMPDARLVLVGEGPHARRIDARIRSMPSVSRIASMPQEDLRRLVGRAALILCPSRLEGFGLAAAEAMASGACVIASGVDGLHDLIRHEDTGLLVPSEDASAWAAAILGMFDDDALRSSLGIVAQQRLLDAFDPSDARQRLTEALEALAA